MLAATKWTHIRALKWAEVALLDTACGSSIPSSQGATIKQHTLEFALSKAKHLAKSDFI
jgi:hypothetical protein